MADPVQRLVAELSRLPGIGEKTATRLAFHLVRAPGDQVRALAEALVELVEKIRLCSSCMNVTDDDPCGLCRDARRDPETICVVATPSDLTAIERGGHYRGRYHVLHGLLSPLDGIGPDDLRIADLVRRLGPGDGTTQAVREVIVATSPSVEGEATAMYLARLIKPLGVRVSRIATGLPVGGEIEYTDQATLARALAHRSVL
jgi:recombination protein RecR